MIESFKKNGYLHVPKVISQELLNRLRNMASNIEKEALLTHKSGVQMDGVCVIKDPVGDRVMRCDDLFAHDFDLLNKMIASPKLLRTIKSICGPTAIVLQSDLLFKQQHPHPVIKWHQGAPTDHDSHFLNIGVYLDAALKDDGCVRYVPETQHALQDIEHVEKNFGWNPPNVVQVPTEPGDAVFQEMMVLHASEPKRSPEPRRTIYIEVRPYEALVEEGKLSREWIEIRKSWMSEILKNDKEGVFTKNEKAFFESNVPFNKEELILKLKSLHEPPIPAVYSIFDNEGPDYPIPSDLK